MRCCLIVTALLLLIGCTQQERGEVTVGGTRGISKADDAAFIRPGLTTRQDVLERLGEPAEKSDSEFRYTWKTSDYWAGEFLPSGNYGGDLQATWREQEHVLTVQFDERGTVARSALRDLPAQWVQRH